MHCSLNLLSINSVVKHLLYTALYFFKKIMQIYGLFLNQSPFFRKKLFC